MMRDSDLSADAIVSLGPALCARCGASLAVKRADARFCRKRCKDAAEKSRSRTVAAAGPIIASRERPAEPMGAFIESRYRALPVGAGAAVEFERAAAVCARWSPDMLEAYRADLSRGERVGSNSLAAGAPKKRPSESIASRHFEET